MIRITSYDNHLIIRIEIELLKQLLCFVYVTILDIRINSLWKNFRFLFSECTINSSQSQTTHLCYKALVVVIEACESYSQIQ